MSDASVVDVSTMSTEPMPAAPDSSGTAASQTPVPGGPPEASAPAEAAAAPAEQLAALQAELAQLREQNLRLIAEARNVQQRALRDKAEALRFAEAEFARELLVVLDDLERTLAAAPNDSAPIVEGVRLVHDQFLKILRSRGIVPIEAVGRPFDPERHQAVLQQASTEHPAGVVVQEVARGYMMHERVLRPSRVIVSSGPPTKPEAGSMGVDTGKDEGKE